jgi:hypothetical protein
MGYLVARIGAILSVVSWFSRRVREREGAAGGQDHAAVAVRLLRAAVPADPWNNPAVWPAWRLLLPHVLAAADAGRGLNSVADEVSWLFDRAGVYLQTRGEPNAALPLLQQAYDLDRDRLGPDHPDTLIAASALAAILFALGELDRSRELNEDTYARRRRVLGEDHADTLGSAGNLAINLHALGELDRSRELNEDTYAHHRRVLGEDHPDTLTAASNLAADLHVLGELDRSRELNEDTYARRRRVLGEDHPDTLTSANNLAISLRALDERARARD